MSDVEVPEPDRIDGAPHPRETSKLFGQDTAQAGFLEAYNTGRLHHGWLITGPRGVGKATLAWKIARFLLATPMDDGGMFGAPPPPETLDIEPEHPVARRMAAGSEAGLFVLRRPYDEKAGRLKREITVDEARKLKSFFSLSATEGGRRVVIVDAADELNVSAANALLKLLEEPPEDAFLLLISHQPSRLLPTIRSRCRELRLNTLLPDQMEAAIAQADVDPSDHPAALAELSSGSVGEAIRLTNLDGLAFYADLITLFSTLPDLNRQAALKLAESCAGRGKEDRFDLVLGLLDILLSRLARAGISGPPPTEACRNEGEVLSRLSPHDVAARQWAQLAQDLGARARHGRAVNLDPAALILDMLLKIQQTAAKTAS